MGRNHWCCGKKGKTSHSFGDSRVSFYSRSWDKFGQQFPFCRQPGKGGCAGDHHFELYIWTIERGDFCLTASKLFAIPFSSWQSAKMQWKVTTKLKLLCRKLQASLTCSRGPLSENEKILFMLFPKSQDKMELSTCVWRKITADKWWLLMQSCVRRSWIQSGHKSWVKGARPRYPGSDASSSGSGLSISEYLLCNRKWVTHDWTPSVCWPSLFNPGHQPRNQDRSGPGAVLDFRRALEVVKFCSQTVGS